MLRLFLGRLFKSVFGVVLAPRVFARPIASLTFLRSMKSIDLTVTIRNIYNSVLYKRLVSVY